MTKTTLPIRKIPVAHNPYSRWLLGLGIGLIVLAGFVALIGIGDASVRGYYPFGNAAWAVGLVSTGAVSMLLWLTVEGLRWTATVDPTGARAAEASAPSSGDAAPSGAAPSSAE